MFIKNDSFKIDIISSSIFNTFFQIIIFLARIIQVPIILKFYGVNNYGGIILMISIASYFTIFELGFKNYIINKSIKLYFEKKYEDFEEVYFQSIRFIICISSILVLTVTITCSVFYYLEVLFDNKIWLISIIILITYVLLGNIFTLVTQYFRIINKQLITHFIDAFTILLPILLLLFYIHLKTNFKEFDIIIYSLINLISIVIVFILVIWKLKFDINIKNFFFGNINFKIIFKNLKKSIFFTVFSSNTILITHSITQIIAISLSNSDVTIFNTTKMITNLIIFFIGSFSMPFLADITRRNKIENKREMKSILEFYHYTIFVILFSGSLFLYFFGGIIYNYWLSNIEIVFDYKLFELLILSTILHVYNLSNSNILISTNNHIKLSIINICTSIAFIILSFYLINKFLLIGIVYSIILLEITNVILFNFILFKEMRYLGHLFFKNLIIFLLLLSSYLLSKTMLGFVIFIFLFFFLIKLFKSVKT